MKILDVVVSPNPLLKQKSVAVEVVDEGVRELVADMFTTMYASNGIGLAAVQVGVLRRIIVVDTEWGSSRYESSPLAGERVSQEQSSQANRGGNPIALINPEIVEQSPELREYDEGCLSFPAQYSSVTRPDNITVEYLDLEGRTQRLHADGLLATCIQHEIDHINGVVFIDHISRLKRDMIMRKMKKAEKLKEA
jgi:peptide deformylase